MKQILILAMLLFCLSSFGNTEFEEAPMEWLITATLQQKMAEHEHEYGDHDHKGESLEFLKEDELVRRIFQNIDYSQTDDEIILTSSQKTNDLRYDLVDFLSTQPLRKKADPKFQAWLNEGQAVNQIVLYKTNYAPKGHYYFNHIHTNLSKDNSSMKWFKYSPKETYSLVKTFLKNRRTLGSVTFTDHDTDKAYDDVKDIQNPILKSLRGVEWGGSTHMCLIGIKENWDNLSHGREFAGEESVRQSRSSEGFRIVNHPNRKKPHFSHLSWLDADGVEVWNTILENAPFNIERSNNRDAFKQWTDSLERGQSYTAMAGSDFHFAIPCLRDRSMMYPANYIPGTDTASTKDSLFKGRVSFVTKPTAPKLILQAKFAGESNWAQMGDKISGNNKLQVELFGDFSDTNKRIGGACYNVVRKFYKWLTFWKKDFWQIRFYNLAGELIAKRDIKPSWYSYKKHFKATLELENLGTDIVRAELWAVNKKNKSIDLLGATNPIYINW